VSEFTHLRVELRGLMVAGKVWDKGDLVPLDGSTPLQVTEAVLKRAGKLEHPHLTPGKLAGDEFVPFNPKVKAKAEAEK